MIKIIKKFIRDAVLKIQVNSMKKKLLKRQPYKDQEYQEYLHNQIRRSYPKAKQTFEPLPRTVILADILKPFASDSPKTLSIGCRSAIELFHLEKVLGGEVIGLDLFSQHEKIIVGDMHASPFGDEEFDIIYSSHSLEHSYDIDKAISEFFRILKSDGLLLVEMPVKYKTNNVDLWDLKSSDELINRLRNFISEIYVNETISDSYCNHAVIRIIVRKK